MMKKRLYHFLTALFAALIFLSFSGSRALADNELPSPEDLNSRIRLSSTEEYDISQGFYLFDVSGSLVTMNLPNGIVTNSPVSLGIPAGMTAKLYRDGNLISQPDFTNLSEPGGYIVLLGNNDAFSLNFTIVSEYDNNLVHYNLPEGFSVQQVLRDGQLVSSVESTVDMKKDGHYVIDYGCDYIGKAYRLEVTLDHSAPTLTISGVENGFANGPVEITEDEPGCVVTVLRDGDKIPFKSPLTGSGKYTVTVQDDAGNYTDYNFTIGVYFSLNRLTVAIVLFAAFALALAYILISRKRLRIR